MRRRNTEKQCISHEDQRELKVNMIPSLNTFSICNFIAYVTREFIILRLNY